MKKNLLSVLILALLIVNIVLTTITMISVTSTNKATASLVKDIAGAISLELGTEEEAQAVSMEDTEAYDVPDTLTIPLKKSEDGKDHYAVVTASLVMNTKDKGYKTYGGTIDSKLSLIKGAINDVFVQHTKDEAVENKEEIENEVLEKIQDMFGSRFIYKVVLNTVYQ